MAASAAQTAIRGERLDPLSLVENSSYFRFLEAGLVPKPLASSWVGRINSTDLNARIQRLILLHDTVQTVKP